MILRLLFRLLWWFRTPTALGTISDTWLRTHHDRTYDDNPRALSSWVKK